MMTCSVMVALSVAASVPAQAEKPSVGHDLPSSLSWLIATWESPDAADPYGMPAARMSFQWKAGKQVVLWEGTYAAEEAAWSFVATIFYDRQKDRLRVFAFNSHGQRHLGLLEESSPERLAWTMSGLRADGRPERFVAEFVRRGDGTMDFKLRDRRPADEAAGGDSTVRLRRVDGTSEDARATARSP
jgi:hypothetical protein